MYGTLVILQTTSFCNIDCKYCYLPNRASTKKMSPELIEKILDTVLKSSAVKCPVTFVHHVGEPLVMPKDYYRHFSERLRFFSEKYNRRTEQSIQTNAILIDQEWISIFKEFGIKLGVSVDGPQFIHDSNRITRNGKGTHDLVMRGVRYLQAHSIDFNTIMVLTTEALDYPDEIFTFFVENGFRYVGLNIDEFGATSYTSSFTQQDAAAISQKYRKFMRRMIELSDKREGKLVIREFTKIAASLIRDAHGQKHIFNGVRTPLNILNFDVDGNFNTFSPELLNAKSQIYGDFLMGNVFTDNIEDILESNKYKRIHSEIQAGVSICEQTCDYWRFCGGGSPADKFYEYGRLDIGETTACRFHKKMMIDEYLEYLMSDANAEGSMNDE